MSDLPYGPYEATVRIRRGGCYSVKPEAEALEGQRLTFTRGWVIGDEESDIYGGETAWIPVNWDACPLGWIAGGDLTDFAEAKHD